MALVDHPLAGAVQEWRDVREEFGEGGVEGNETDKIAASVVRAAAQTFHTAVAKFGKLVEANANRAALTDAGQEVAATFRAILAHFKTMLTFAGPCLRAELREAGNDVASLLDALGTAGHQLGLCLVKALERVKDLERISTHNRAAIRKRFLRSISQLRDMQQDLQDSVQKQEDEDYSDFGFDERLKTSEQGLAVSVVVMSQAVGEGLMQASQLCMPPVAGCEGVPIPLLEAAAVHSVSTVSALDALARHTFDGLDAKELAKFRRMLASAVAGLEAAAPALGGVAEISRASQDVERALACATGT
mmetsp:Transcript_38899/g.103345  ORF Transcript_38899/g.103345 Transcript_38899/m.103345 type:complete len:304 (-) Transcript_38899:277-1188(-)